MGRFFPLQVWPAADFVGIVCLPWCVSLELDMEAPHPGCMPFVTVSAVYLHVSGFPGIPGARSQCTSTSMFCNALIHRSHGVAESKISSLRRIYAPTTAHNSLTPSFCTNKVRVVLFRPIDAIVAHESGLVSRTPV